MKLSGTDPKPARPSLRDVGEAIADVLFPAVVEALTKPLPPEWSEDQVDSYVFNVIAKTGAGIKGECAGLDCAAEGEADIIAYCAEIRLVRRMRAVGLVQPFKVAVQRHD